MYEVLNIYMDGDNSKYPRRTRVLSRITLHMRIFIKDVKIINRSSKKDMIDFRCRSQRIQDNPKFQEFHFLL